MMLLTPLRDAIEIALDSELLFCLAPGNVMPTANLFASPRRSLMCKGEEARSNGRSQ